MRPSIDRLSVVLILCVAATSGAHAEPTYGTLADGAESISEQSGVHAEICRDHLLNPSAVDARLPDGYRLTAASELAAKDEQLVALIRRDAPQPGFMTVLFSGANADVFTVFTYFGHHHREATGQWTATGRNAFTDAFRIRGEAEAFGTFFQDGWHARAGLYRRR